MNLISFMLIFINKIHSLLFFALSLILASCGGCSSNSNDSSWADDGYSDYEEEPAVIEDNSIKIAYTEQYGNTITIPVKINGMLLDMIFDTGASSTCITLVEAQYLYMKGNLTKEDFIDMRQFQTADGKISAGLRINLRDVEIGDKIVLHNVEALVIENQQAPLLLGQSVMKKFSEISVDRKNGVVKFLK
jgi:aspartyl protease family protein